MLDLSGRRALVSGASRGIGRAIAVRLARGGADVAVNYLSSEDAAAQVKAEIEQLGRRALLCQADIRDAQAVDEMVKAVAADLGGLDIVVNNAGMVRDQYLTFMKDEAWDEVMDVSLRGAFMLTKRAIKHMIRGKWGRVVNISSAAGLMGDLRRTNYAAAKAGLIAASRALASEVARLGVRVNVVAPGLIATDMIKDAPVENIKEMIPMGRIGRPEEVAKVVRFLCSDDASYITGQVISVNGGMF